MGMPNYEGQLPPQPPPPLGPQSKGNATTALVLGIISIVCCQILGPIAWFLGNKELKAIRAGIAPASGEGTAKAGMILGIIATAILGFALIWLLFGGMAILMSALREGYNY